MRIALIGYGKMGKIIEEMALQKGHEIMLKIDIDSLKEFTDSNLRKADVAIEFTGPHSAYANVMTCLKAGIPVVCGSTGWQEKFEDAKHFCQEHGGSFIWSSNFSIGVNIFFEINKRLAELMNAHPDYDVTMTEVHHMQKKDAPSGTAISMAEQIIGRLKRKKIWVNHISDKGEELEIISERVDPAPGIHRVKYSSAIDDIEIIHDAHNRKGFAAGAVLAAEFIKNKKGIFTMKEVLGL